MSIAFNMCSLCVFLCSGYLSMCPALTHTSCPSSITNAKCLSQNQICDFINDCPGEEDESSCLGYKRCDFQKDTCDWMASRNTSLEWRRILLYNDVAGK